MNRDRDRLLLWILLAHLPIAGLVAFLSDTASIMHAVGEMAVVPVLAWRSGIWQVDAPTGTSPVPC